MDPQRSHYYTPHQYSNGIVYPQLLSNPAPDPAQSHDRDAAPKPHEPPKAESKPQATFLTKLYASVALPSRSSHPTLTFSPQPPRASGEPPHD